MTSANDGTNTEAFTYAGDGQRRKKSTSSEDINYLWDEPNVLEELDGNDGLIAHYTDFPGYWGGLSSLALPTGSFTQVAGMGAFNAVQFNQATFNQNETTIEVESHFYLFDLQSSNRLLLDTNAAKDNEYLYKAFGEKVLSTGSIRNPFQFQGQVGPYFDANDRTWMRARIYNPSTGRWDSQDPTRFDGSDWNLFRFVLNDPINNMDPSGLISWRVICCNSVISLCCPPKPKPKKRPHIPDDILKDIVRNCSIKAYGVECIACCNTLSSQRVIGAFNTAFGGQSFSAVKCQNTCITKCCPDSPRKTIEAWIDCMMPGRSDVKRTLLQIIIEALKTV